MFHSDNNQNIRIYSPNQNTGWGWQVWHEMVLEIVSSRGLIWRLFLRNFKAKYTQTFLGWSWAFIMPLFTVGAFVFLNMSGVLNIGHVDIPYPAYALLGLSIWQIFSGGLNGGSRSIVAGGSMVVKINFPKEALVLSAYGLTFVDVLIRLSLTTVVFLYFKIVPAWSVLLFPVSIIPVIMLTLGLSLLLSLLNAIFRDVVNIVSLFSTFLLFATPVLYPEPRIPIFKFFCLFNPLAVLISGPRDLVIKGSLSQPNLFYFYSCFSIILFLVSWRLFHLAEVRIAERISAR